jgi:hypothetical protein
MRNVTTREIYLYGNLYRATIIQDPNIDDVIVAEAEAEARSVRTGEDRSDDRVSREVREILLRFGVRR